MHTHKNSSKNGIWKTKNKTWKWNYSVNESWWRQLLLGTLSIKRQTTVKRSRTTANQYTPTRRCKTTVELGTTTKRAAKLTEMRQNNYFVQNDSEWPCYVLTSNASISLGLMHLFRSGKVLNVFCNSKPMISVSIHAEQLHYSTPSRHFYKALFRHDEKVYSVSVLSSTWLDHIKKRNPWIKNIPLHSLHCGPQAHISDNWRARRLCANLHLIFADTAACEQGSYLHFSSLAN